MTLFTQIFVWFGDILKIYDFDVNFGDFTVNFKSIIIFIFMLNILLLVFKVLLKNRGSNDRN